MDLPNENDWNWVPNSDFHWRFDNNSIHITKKYSNSKRFVLCSLFVIFLLNGIVFSILYVRFKFDIPFVGIYTKLEIIGFIGGLIISIPLSIKIVNRKQLIKIANNEIVIINGLIKRKHQYETGSSFFIEKGYIGGRQAHQFQKMKLNTNNGKTYTIASLAAPVNDGLNPLLKKIREI